MLRLTVLFILFSSQLASQEERIISTLGGNKTIGIGERITIESSSGDEISGILIFADIDKIQLETSFGVIDIPLANIKEIESASYDLIKNESWPADPNSRRSFVLPTAQTVPKGQKVYENYYLFFHSFYLGIHDQLTLNAGFSAFPSNKNFIENQAYTLGIKGKIFDNRDYRLSGGLQFFKMPWSEEDDINKYTYMYGVLGIGDPDRTQLNLSVGYVFGTDADSPMLYSLNGGTRISRNFSFMCEVMSVAEQKDPDYSNFLYSYGLRFMARKLAVDLGFMNIMKDPVFPGIPIINFVYAWK